MCILTKDGQGAALFGVLVDRQPELGVIGEASDTHVLRTKKVAAPGPFPLGWELTGLLLDG
ncbi:hypothetical protein ACFLT5_03045 [Chloroflexota bacterium]